MGVRLRPGKRCTCTPSQGYHQHHCAISQKMRAELIEAGKAQQAPDPARRARV